MWIYSVAVMDEQINYLDFPEHPAVPAERRRLARHAAIDHHSPTLRIDTMQVQCIRACVRSVSSLLTTEKKI